MDGKVFVIGLDGASFNIIDPFIKSGHLPTIANILKKGRGYHLNSTIPSNTPVAWTSMTTGKNPGKHGVFGFYKYSLREMRSVSSLDNKSLCIWDILGTHNKTSIVINVPFTWPPHKINGVLACFKPIQSNDDILAEPPFVNRYIKERRFDKIATFHPEYPSLDLTRFRKVASLETDFAIAMHQHYDWDMMFIVFMITDTVVHLYPHSKDTIKNVYQIVDNAICQLLEIIDLKRDTILITSDHGTKIYTQGYPFPAFLRENGLLFLRTSIKKRQQFSFILGEVIKEVLFRLSDFAHVNPISIINSIKLLRARVLENNRFVSLRFRSKDRDIDTGIDGMNNSVVDTDMSPLLIAGENSRVDILLKINEDKFSQNRRSELIKKILDRINSNTTIITNAWTSEELYTGPYVKNAPDIILEINNNLAVIEKPLSYYSRAKIAPFLVGGHQRRGICIVAGKDVSPLPNARPEANILDITPTILHMLQVPIPKDVDGKVIEELFDRTSSLSELPKYSNTDSQRDVNHAVKSSQYSSHEEKEIWQRLKRLGYV